MYKRQKYYNVRIKSGRSIVGRFECIRDAAEWLVENHWSKSIPAARVGMSTVLTGKRSAYRAFGIVAKRWY